MDRKNTEYEYVVRDFTAVDRQITELARRERILTQRLMIENLKRLGVPLIQLSAALAILILAFGVFVWLVKKERIVEVEKTIEIIKEVPVYIHSHSDNPTDLARPRNSGETSATDGESPIRNSPNDGNGASSPSQTVTVPITTEERVEDVENVLRDQGYTVGSQLNFALRWNNTNDLDLHVQTPSGRIIDYRKSRVDGGTLDFDRNANQSKLDRSPIENIKWEEHAPQGQYKVYVSLYRNRSPENISKTKFWLVINNKGVSSSVDGEVDHSSVGKMQLVTTVKFSE